MIMVKYFYAAASMGFGKGYIWHKFFKFPKFDIITKSITLKRRIGNPFAIIHLGNSIYNRVGLHNPGIKKWIEEYYDPNLILSIAGTDGEIEEIIEILNDKPLKGIELNFSCPNVKSFKNKKIPKTNYKLFLKLNYKQDPYDYDLNKIKRIDLNSVPRFYGGVSGELAKRYNWEFIRRYKNLPVSGCSFSSMNDIKRLEEYLGCKKMSIGSVMLINPFLIKNLKAPGV
jgi:dihydroorotate dehydrogenase